MLTLSDNYRIAKEMWTYNYIKLKTFSKILKIESYNVY